MTLLLRFLCFSLLFVEHSQRTFHHDGKTICVKTEEGMFNNTVKAFAPCYTCHLTQYSIDDMKYRTYGCVDSKGDQELYKLFIGENASAPKEFTDSKNDLNDIMCGDQNRTEIIRFDIRFSNATIKVIRKCCKTFKCNSHLSHVDYSLLPKVRFNEISVKYRRSSEELDVHYAVVDHLQGAVLVCVMIGICFWPLYTFKRNEKTTVYEEDKNAAVDYDFTQQNRPEMFQVKTKDGIPREVSGQLSLYQLCEMLCLMEESRPPGEESYFLSHCSEDTREPLLWGQQYHQASGFGHGPIRVMRDIYPKYDLWTWRILEHGPYEYNFKPVELVEIFDHAKDICATEPLLIHLSSKNMPVCIIGDIRGHYQDLHRWLYILGTPPQKKLLFLGGVLDKSESLSLDCLAFIALLKARFPHDVFLLRGVGEAQPFEINSQRFSPRNALAISSAVMRLCSYLPLAAKINNRILCVHSGISHQMRNPRSFRDLERPFPDYDLPMLATQTIFNLPSCRVRMYRRGTGHRGEIYGFQAVDRLCEDLKLDLIVRARNPISDGNAFIMKGKLLCLWSAPGFSDDISAGCALEVSDDRQTLLIHSLLRQP